MIYLFYGSDASKARAKAFQWAAAARAKAPDAAYIRLTADQVTEDALADAMGSQGLFFAKSLILLDDPFSQSDSAELVLARLDALQASDNPIAIIAPKLLPARAKKLEALAAKLFKIDAVAKPSRGFNSGLVNALAAKDGELLWREIQNAYRQGDAPEMVHGLLHWKARDLMQKGSRAWSPLESRTLSRDLILLLSDSRGKDVELGVGLERFALGI